MSWTVYYTKAVGFLNDKAETYSVDILEYSIRTYLDQRCKKDKYDSLVSMFDKAQASIILHIASSVNSTVIGAECKIFPCAEKYVTAIVHAVT